MKPTKEGDEDDVFEEFWHNTHSHTFAYEASSRTNLNKNVHRLDSRAFLVWLGQGEYRVVADLGWVEPASHIEFAASLIEDCEIITQSFLHD